MTEVQEINTSEENQELKVSNIPINLDSIYKSLLNVLSKDQSHIIFRNIKKIIIFPRNKPELDIINTIGITADGEILISEEFWNNYIETIDDLSIIMLHEFLHPLLGDTDFFNELKDDPEITIKAFASNIACDARINAYIHRYTELNAEEFFKRVYTEELLNEELLLNLVCPHGSFPYYDEAYGEPAQRYIAKFKMIRTFLYGSNQIKNLTSSSAMYTVVLDYLRAMRNSKKEVSTDFSNLLGSHPDPRATKEAIENLEPCHQQQNKQYKKSEEAEEEIRQVFEESISESAGSTDGTLASIFINEEKSEDRIDTKIFDRISFKNTFKNIKSQIYRTKEVRYKSPILPSSISSSDVGKIMLDIPVVFWDSVRYEPERQHVLCPIYIDVSGSMYRYLPMIINLVTNIEESLDYIWGFSEKVHKHTMEMLKNNHIVSTGGTSFNCVLEHALEEQFEHIMVITDGYAYAYPELIERAKKQFKSVTVVATDHFYHENILSKTFNNTLKLTEITI